MNIIKILRKTVTKKHPCNPVHEAIDNVENLINIAEAIKKLNFGKSQALPWCRESFPELDKAMKKYEEWR